MCGNRGAACIVNGWRVFASVDASAAHGSDLDEGWILSGNATFRHTNSAILAVSSVEAPVVVTSREFDKRLEPSLKRLRLSKKLLERVAGVSDHNELRLPSSAMNYNLANAYLDYVNDITLATNIIDSAQISYTLTVSG